MDPHRRRTLPHRLARVLLLAGVAALAVPAAGGAQILGGGRERADAMPVTSGLPQWRGGFTFCRLVYQRDRPMRSGLGWSTDYPVAEHNFMTRLEELTTTPLSVWLSGEPGYAAVRATDPDLFKCPYLFMTDPGSVDFTDAEVERLREFLLKGGFLWADDLWDDPREWGGAWNYLFWNMRRILPDHAIVELTPEHPLLSAHYIVPEIRQIPSVNNWRRTGGSSEVPGVTDRTGLYGIFDESGRLMVLISYNSDYGDGWEREGDDREYFYTFAPYAYAVGINVAIWVMTR